MRQGRTAYPHLLVQFDSLEVTEESFNTDEKTCVEKYNGTIQPQMSGLTYDIVSRVFRAVVDKKVLIAGVFRSRSGGSCIRCNFKANDGYLYVMEKSFFFVKKPLMQIKYSDVTEVSFRRVSSSASGSKSFDMHVMTNEEHNNVSTHTHKHKQQRRRKHTQIEAAAELGAPQPLFSPSGQPDSAGRLRSPPNAVMMGCIAHSHRLFACLPFL